MSNVSTHLLIERFNRLPTSLQEIVSRARKEVDGMLEQYRLGRVNAEEVETVGICLVKIVEEIALQKQLIGPARGLDRPSHSRNRRFRKG